jgi:cytochrome c
MQKSKTGGAPGVMIVAALNSAALSSAASYTAVFIVAAFGAAVAVVMTAGAASAADAAHGKVVFETCAACHSGKPDAIGPSLQGVFGRKSASLEDFRYSNAMRRANLTWDDANLQAYIKDPQAKVKGNRMPFGGLSDEKDAADVIAYLKDYK